MIVNAKRIFAIDPATVLGWCHSNGKFGSIDLSVPRDHREGARMLRTLRLIRQAHDAWGVDEIAVEEAAFGSKYFATKQFHNLMLGAILIGAAEIDAPVFRYRPIDIKLFATGHGHASKEQMIATCISRLGKSPQDDNAADAIWICEMRKAFYAPPETKKKKAKRIERKRAKDRKLF